MKRFLLVTAGLVLCFAFLISAREFHKSEENLDFHGFTTVKFSYSTESGDSSDEFFGDSCLQLIFFRGFYGFAAGFYGMTLSGKKTQIDVEAPAAYSWIHISRSLTLYLGTVPSYHYRAPLLLDDGSERPYWIPGTELRVGTREKRVRLLVGEWSLPFRVPTDVAVLSVQRRGLFYLTAVSYDPRVGERATGLSVSVERGDLNLSFAITNGKPNFARTDGEKYSVSLSYRGFTYDFVGTGALFPTSRFVSDPLLSSKRRVLHTANAFHLFKYRFTKKLGNGFDASLTLEAADACGSAYAGDERWSFGGEIKLKRKF